MRLRRAADLVLLGLRVWEESKAGVSKILACSLIEHPGGMDLESAIRAGEIIAENLQHSLQWRQ